MIGLRRAGFSEKDREEIKAAFKLVYLSGLNISQMIEKAATMKVATRSPASFWTSSQMQRNVAFARSNAGSTKRCRPNENRANSFSSNSRLLDRVQATLACGRFFLFRPDRSNNVLNRRQCIRRNHEWFSRQTFTTLADNFRREIDFVMWRPNAWAELHYHVRGIGAEAINHLLDSVGNDAEVRCLCVRNEPAR